jgi:hypothetical protein
LERLRVETPAAWLDCLTCAGGRALARKAVLWMRGRGESCALFAGDELLAVAFLVVNDEGQHEFCLSVRRTAAAHIRALCRLAHSTLSAAAENGGVVICHVSPGNRSGARMARLTGFRHEADTLWTFSSGDDGDGSGKGTFRRGRCGEARSAAEPGVAAGGE